MKMGNIKLASVTIDSSDFRGLSEFYMKLLGGQVAMEFGEFGVAVSIPGTEIQLNFVNSEDYVLPVWPEEPGKPQQMEHLDFVVDDLDAAVKLASELGAHKAPRQFIDELIVMIDPAGHPFCLIPK